MCQSRFPRKSVRALLGILLAGCSSVLLWGQRTALDLDGKAANPLAVSGDKIVVLVFLRRDCPVSGRYAPIIQHLSRRYEDKASFSLVFPDKADTPDEIRKYLGDYGYHLPALRDAQHELVKLAGVEITPEVAVFDRRRQLVYDGRIDNTYVDITRTRLEPTTHELDDAIQSALAGKPVAAHEIRGVGCYIADLE